VIREFSLTIRAGEIITIIGPSGCGKTTLLRAIAGLLLENEENVACEGSISIFGMSPSEAKRQRMFAFTFQNPVLLPWRTVKQNVSLPLEIINQKSNKNRSLVDEMLSMVGIADFAHSLPSGISGGMQQRANLARALVQEPRILLMDEPFGSLDEVTRERLNFELLKIHHIRRPTILFITHSLSEATLLADRIVILGKRPATIREEIQVKFQHKRTEALLLTPEYINLVRKVRSVFVREDSAA